MGTDKIENALDRAEGTIKEHAGQILDDEHLEAEGRKDQAKADVGDAIDDVKDGAKKAVDGVKEAAQNLKDAATR